MIISDRKRAANLANAQKSTGPKSPEGKLISSCNSGRHRTLAHTIVLDNENPQNFCGILSAFTAEHQPQDATERAFVERMAVCHWRLLRSWAMEAADIRLEKKRQTGALLLEDAPTRTVAAVRSLSASERHPDPIGRKETRYSREFYSALEALNKSRDRKKRVEATDLPDSKDSEPAIEPTEVPIEPTNQPIEPTDQPIEPTI